MWPGSVAWPGVARGLRSSGGQRRGLLPFQEARRDDGQAASLVTGGGQYRLARGVTLGPGGVRGAVRVAAGGVQQLLAPLGLYPGQEFVIMELAARGPAIQARIADAIGSEPPSVTLMVRKLEAAGYVKRTPASGDRRTTTVELTAAGRKLAQQIRRLWTVLGEQTLGDLDDPPADQIAALLNKLAASIAAATPASAAADAISKRTAS
jgi:DNA-binding MarR family transcriptional regulator